jgi:PmbA protein
MSANLMQIAESFLALARSFGADAAEVMAVASTDMAASVRNNIPETLERAESRALGLRVFIGQSYATVSTSDFSPDALKIQAEAAIAIARAAPPDPFTSLAPAERLARTIPNLDCFDPNEPTLEALLAQCRETEEIGRAHAGITNSEGADASYGAYETCLLTSAGFSGLYRGSMSGLSLSLIGGVGGDMQRDYAYASARHRADLPTAEAIGREAATRTLGRLNPHKISSGKLPILFEPRVGKSLLSAFASAISGASVARGTSFLKSAMGEAIFAPGIRILDDPQRKRGLASRPFDGEGVATKPLALVENGVLQTWLLDMRSANQLGLQTTGHAARSLGGAPSPSASNLHLENGVLTPEALMADITDGLYITETFGMGVNLTTGDYSQGAGGFRIRGGALAEPVSEITIAGQLRDMFRALTPANDLQFHYATNVPTFRIDGMTVAGA